MSTVSLKRGGHPIALPPTGLLIDGTWRSAEDAASIDVVDPSTEEVIVSVACASDADIDSAVRAARAQVDGGAWARTSPADRGRLLARVAELVQRDAEVLARLEALEVGKPVGDSLLVEVPQAVDTFAHFSTWADQIRGESIPVPDFLGRPRHCYTRREPVGVVGAIVAWNAPTMTASWKLAPALAAGCSVVLKPSEDAPLAIAHLVSLIEEAGIPAGTVNLTPGTGSGAGATLAAHPGVDKISFTGSPEAGRLVARSAANTFKRVTLELGGKSPQIFLGDADLEAALPVAAMSLFANAGQVCASGSRVLAHRTVHDEVVAGLAAAATAIRVGDPFARDTTMGAIVSQRQLDRVLGYIDSGVEQRAELVAGGHRLARRGYFVEPTIFASSNDLKIAQEEIFGPVGTVIPFDTTEEAVAIANGTKYGLTAVLWTRDVSQAHRLAAEVRAGAVWVNGWGTPDPRVPWGGVKASGLGRELGRAGIEAHTEEKLVSVVL